MNINNYLLIITYIKTYYIDNREFRSPDLKKYASYTRIILSTRKAARRQKVSVIEIK